ncbi:MAG: hypothetical protein HW421_867 [Ignavibacteria bacterium]|nr:hypothetical protein [Ignavibacteria bacterium]
MKEPIIKKYPTEIFGCPFIGQEIKLKSAFKQQYCKYINGTCVKPRKSEPHIKVGICSLGYNVDGKYLPIIICPQRFKEEVLFDTLREKYLSHWDNIQWISEVNLGVGGSIDFVAITRNKKGEIIDFFCIELQAGGTTGSPFPAVIDLKNSGYYQKDSYNYGINWANEFSKTMMQQAYKKGKIIKHWNRKIIFVIQDVGMNYIQKSSNTTGLEKYNAKLPIDFCTFELIWNETLISWKLKFKEIYSTDIEGINLMLGGTEIDSYPSENDFILNIIKKGIADGIFTKDEFRTNI